MLLGAWYPKGKEECDCVGAIQATHGDTISIFQTRLWTNVLIGDNETVLYLKLELSKKSRI